MADRIVNFERMEDLVGVLGSFDENIKMIERQFGVETSIREGELRISGDEEKAYLAEKVIGHLLALASKGEQVNNETVAYVIDACVDGVDDKLAELASDCVCVTAKGKPIKAKTLGQKSYLDAIKNNTIVFAVGPAGTGKTYLAVAAAVTAFREKKINKIILTRPAVEAGEKLGFLPGDLQNKVDPYLRPLYDALFDMLGAENHQKFLERGNIEIAPLAYMRGRTLDDAFIILDEAQNTTPEQMKMFLTRLGANSKAVITGDVTQMDIPEGKKSGLVDAIKILDKIEDIKICKLSERDVVRHRLVQRIIKAYGKAEEERNKRKGKYVR